MKAIRPAASSSESCSGSPVGRSARPVAPRSRVSPVNTRSASTSDSESSVWPGVVIA